MLRRLVMPLRALGLAASSDVRSFADTPVWLAPDASAGFQCSACGKGFRLLNALNHHIATRHAGQAKPLAVGADGKISGEAAAAATPAAASPLKQAAAPPPRPATGGAPMSSMPNFPGLFPGAVGTTSTLGNTPAPAEASSEGAAGSSTDDSEKKLFVCTVCQKTFRLEAALQHHYQAKHGMEMPTTTPAPPSVAAKASGPLGNPSSSPLQGAFGVNLSFDGAASSDATAGTATSTQYVHGGDGPLPSMPQYHLDVAPNAPEEGDIAAHWRLVNHCVLLGSVSEVQEGYVFEDRVVQCVVATDFDNPSPGDPDKDFHTVRVYGGPETLKAVREMAVPNARVLVSGRLRLVPQFDTTTNKYYHHPILIVQEGGGTMQSIG